MEQEGMIDIHNRQKEFERTLECFKKDSYVCKENKELIIRFVEDCEAGKTLRGRQKKKIGVARLTRIIDGLKHFAYWFDKPFNLLAQADLERVITNLEKDVYLKVNKNKFSSSSKVYYKKVFKKFDRWMKLNGINNNLDCSYIETYEMDKEVDSINKDDFEKMLEALSSPIHKALLSVMFDGGFRAQEILNVKLKHLNEIEGVYYIRIEFSKTLPRTVSLPIATKYLRQWLSDKNSPKGREDQVFSLTYDALRMIIGRLGKKVLDRNISPHTLRHSSATYYCNILTQYQLCKRYGWGMSSKMPARYIDRSGVLDKEVIEKVKIDETSKLNEENKRLFEMITFLNERLDSIQGEMIRLATQQQAPIHIQTSLGQESYSCSGTNINGTFKKV